MHERRTMEKFIIYDKIGEAMNEVEKAIKIIEQVEMLGNGEFFFDVVNARDTAIIALREKLERDCHDVHTTPPLMGRVHKEANIRYPNKLNGYASRMVM